MNRLIAWAVYWRRRGNPWPTVALATSPAWPILMAGLALGMVLR